MSDEKPGLLNVLEGKENFEDLTKELVGRLEDAIYVYGGNRVEVVFRFQDDRAKTLKNQGFYDTINTQSGL